MQEEFEEIEEPRRSFRPNWWAIGGLTLGGVILGKLLFGQSNPKFPDTDVPDGDVDQAAVQAMASELFELFDNPMFELIDRKRCDALGRFGNFTNANMVATANYYQNKFGITIRQSLSDLTFRPCAPWNNANEEHVLIRFAELNIP